MNPLYRAAVAIASLSPGKGESFGIAQKGFETYGFVKKSYLKGRIPFILVPMTSSTRIVSTSIIAFTGVSYGWVMAFFSDDSLWRMLSPLNGAAVQTAFSVYFILSCISFLGFGAILKPVHFPLALCASSIGPLLSFVLMALFPELEIVFLGATAILALSAGMIFALGLLIIIHCLPLPSKAVPATACIFIFSSVTAALLASAPYLGRMRFLLVVGMLALSGIACLKGMDFRTATTAPVKNQEPLPMALLAWFSLILLVEYFGFYVVQALRIKIGILPFETSFLDWVSRAAILLFLLLFGRLFNIVSLLYGSLVFMMISFVCTLAGPESVVISSLSMNVTYALTDVAIGTILLDLGTKHRNHRMVFIICLFVICCATVAGYGVGSLFSELITASSMLFYGGILAVFALIFLCMPHILKVFDRELASAPAGTDASDEHVTRNLSYVRLSPQLALAALLSHFDGEYSLSGREREVALLLLDRYDYESIAGRLDISVNTLKVHARNVYRKCDVAGRKELIALVTELETDKQLA